MIGGGIDRLDQESKEKAFWEGVYDSKIPVENRRKIILNWNPKLEYGNVSPLLNGLRLTLNEPIYAEKGRKLISLLDAFDFSKPRGDEYTMKWYKEHERNFKELRSQFMDKYGDS